MSSSIIQTESKSAADSTNGDNNNIFVEMSNDILIMIISFNIDHDDDDAMKTLINLKTISKQFYNALNPNNGAVNMIWKIICINKYPNTPQTLKIKRWDQFLKYRMFKINQHKNNDDDFKIFSDKDPLDSVIVNCTYDIEQFNNNNFLYSDNDTSKGSECKFKCPVLSDKLKKIADGTRYCDVCKKNVYTVHTEKDLKSKVENQQYVSMTIYSGICYPMKGDVFDMRPPSKYDRDKDEVDPHQKLRNYSKYFRMILTKYNTDL